MADGMKEMPAVTSKVYGNGRSGPQVPSDNPVGAVAKRPGISSWDGSSYRMNLLGKTGNAHDATYGTPEEGSKTDKRGKKAGESISQEIIDLCENLIRFGERQPDETYMILFGPLFQLYTRISNKVVGTLIRARRHGLVKFEGEMLFQRRDDHVPIYLVQIPASLQELANAGWEGASQRELVNM